MSKNQYKHIKSGDTVIYPYVFGTKKRFIIQSFLGFSIEMAHAVDSSGCEYNLVADKIVLVDALKRPFSNIPLKKLLRLVKVNLDAEREFKIRINIKRYV